MKLATRINSFAGKGKNIIEILQQIASIDGINYVDLNYPEHFVDVDFSLLKTTLEELNLKVNGIALRFRDEFINGELGNQSDDISKNALKLCEEAVHMCKALNGSLVTIWLGYDGFDYSFQLNYANAWRKVVENMKIITNIDPTINISIEYKPFQPRAYSLVPDIGSTLLLTNDVKSDNIGVTLDFCHMLMKGENPAYGLCQTFERNKLFGVHLNDGQRMNDDGLIIGSVNFIQTLEFIYYLKKYQYDGVIYFDTFPVREDPTIECRTNIKMLNKLYNTIDSIGMVEIQKIIDDNDAISAQDILMKCLK
ncbi:MAG: AP endonuclease [Firmicutes bacterium HGW-Firmicutes-1]|jgi:xylose isomerase|nr:MAG: AP endonuclease [Firmicutes bacterium HGW-Firmicutes-1]